MRITANLPPRHFSIFSMIAEFGQDWHLTMLGQPRVQSYVSHLTVYMLKNRWQKSCAAKFEQWVIEFAKDNSSHAAADHFSISMQHPWFSGTNRKQWSSKVQQPVAGLQDLGKEWIHNPGLEKWECDFVRCERHKGFTIIAGHILQCFRGLTRTKGKQNGADDHTQWDDGDSLITRCVSVKPFQVVKMTI